MPAAFCGVPCARAPQSTTWTTRTVSRTSTCGRSRPSARTGPFLPDGVARPISGLRSSAAFRATSGATAAAAWICWAGHCGFRWRPTREMRSAATCPPRGRRRLGLWPPRRWFSSCLRTAPERSSGPRPDNPDGSRLRPPQHCVVSLPVITSVHSARAEGSLCTVADRPESAAAEHILFDRYPASSDYDPWRREDRVSADDPAPIVCDGP